MGYRPAPCSHPVRAPISCVGDLLPAPFSSTSASGLWPLVGPPPPQSHAGDGGHEALRFASLLCPLSVVPEPSPGSHSPAPCPTAPTGAPLLLRSLGRPCSSAKPAFTRRQLRGRIPEPDCGPGGSQRAKEQPWEKHRNARLTLGDTSQEALPPGEELQRPDLGSEELQKLSEGGSPGELGSKKLQHLRLRPWELGVQGAPASVGAQGAPQAEPPEPCPGGPKLCRLGLQVVPNVRGFPQGGFNEPWESREGGSHQASRSCQRHSPPRCESRRVFFTALGPPPLHLLPLPSPWLVLPVRSPRGLSSPRVSALTLGWRP